MASLNPSTQANLMTTRWRPGFGLLPNEEMIVTKDFIDASDGAEKGINNSLLLRKLGIASAETLASTAVTVTMQDIADTVVTMLPTYQASGVEPNLQMLSRIDSEPRYMAALKKQLVASLGTAADVLGAQEVSAFASSSVSGSSAAIVDQSTFLDAWNKLLVNAKSDFVAGQTRATVVIYNKQAKNMVNIPGFTDASITGDSEGGLSRGWVNKPMGCYVRESGNIYTNSGIAHNVMHLEMAIAKAYNTRPTLLDPQPVYTAIRIIAVQDVGFKLYFDEYGIDYQTTSA